MTDKELENIYNEAYKAVYWTSMTLLKNEADAEDVVQDTFVTLIESYESIKDKTKVLPWLKKTAANRCLDRIKLTKTDNMDDEFFDAVEAVPEDFLPDTIVESDEMRKIVMDIINNSLSEEVRRTLILFYFDEMSTKEIAEALGVPQGTVLRRLNFARNKIKKEVEKYEKDNDTKLFGMAIPFLTKLFMKEAEKVAFKPMPASLTNLSASAKASSQGSNLNTNAKNPSNGSGANVSSGSQVHGAGTKAAAGTAKKASGFVINKAVVGGIAAAVAVTATIGTIAVITNKNNTKPEPTAETALQETVEEKLEETAETETSEIETSAEETEIFVRDGNIVTFGHYEQDGDLSNGPEPIEWEILSEEDGRILLMSKYVLDSQPYNAVDEDITWENCGLRTWLNNDFLNAAFSSDEQKIIQTTTLSNPDNELYGVEGGNDTDDKVFCLSVDEAMQYFEYINVFPDEPYWAFSQSYMGEATQYAIDNKVRYDVIEQDRYEGLASGEFYYYLTEDVVGRPWSPWWLRSPGGLSYFDDDPNYIAPFTNASYVSALGDLGWDHCFNEVTTNLGVRPAIWITV